MTDSTEAYRKMQQEWYDAHVGDGNRDRGPVAVVGNFEAHEAYPYEKYLLANLPRTENLVALDFGCGPGRMIKRMAPVFRRVDGVDISKQMIIAATRWTAGLGSKLWVIDGMHLSEISDEEYDLVYCTISFQHIASYEMRLCLLREFFRVLRPGGHLALQMVYMHIPRERWMEHASWRESRDDTRQTNGLADVRLSADNLPEVKEDLEEIGYRNVDHAITPPPHEYPGDWIYIYATKP